MKWNIDALDEMQLKMIHEQALALLESHGIRLMSEPARQCFADHGALVEGEQVRIPLAVVEKGLSCLKESFTLGARNPEQSVHIGHTYPPVCGPAAGMVNVLDADLGRRPARMEDHRNFLKLTQTSPHVQLSAVGMVYATDIDPYDGLYHQVLQAIEVCDKPLMGLTQDARVAADSIEMGRIATEGRYEHFVIGIVNALSPMAWDDKMLESLMVYAEQNQPCIVTCCSMAGMSSHIRLGETLVQNHAEVLAGIILSQLVRPGVPVVYGNTSIVADLRTMIPAPGAPEFALITAAAVQLARLIGVPCRSGGGQTDAKILDAQSGIEAAFNLLFTQMSNVDLIVHGIGLMESFSTISYEKWVMDEEIRDRVLRIFRGVGGPDDDAGAIIGQTLPGGNYLMHPSTLAGFRTEHFTPFLSDRYSFHQWQKKGTTFESRATAAWKHRLALYQQPELAPGLREELDRFVSDRTESDHPFPIKPNASPSK